TDREATRRTCSPVQGARVSGARYAHLGARRSHSLPMNMLPLARWSLLLCALLSLASALSAQAQSSVIDREVIVRFKPDVVLGSPTDGAPAPPQTYSFSTPALQQLLVDAQVETMRQITPGFSPEDRFVTLATGETVGL